MGAETCLHEATPEMAVICHITNANHSNRTSQIGVDHMTSGETTSSKVLASWICDCCMKHRFHCNADICWLHDPGWATLSARTVVRIFGDGSWLGLFCQGNQEIIQTLLSLTLWHWIQLYWCYFHTSCEARKFFANLTFAGADLAVRESEGK